MVFINRFPSTFFGSTPSSPVKIIYFRHPLDEQIFQSIRFDITMADTSFVMSIANINFIKKTMCIAEDVTYKR